jgi:hypothetical protein
MPVVRISKGKFNVSDLATAEQLLEESERVLREPLSHLHGPLHYYVGIDRVTGYLTNVSVWDSVESAHQMDGLQPMLEQRPLLEAAGVTFETITNHETVWTISPCIWTPPFKQAWTVERRSSVHPYIRPLLCAFQAS